MKARRLQRGSVLIIVLWVSFGLISVALYFAHSMRFEMRAADNRVAGIEAEQAIAGAARYVSNLLATAEIPGVMPDLETYSADAVQLGDSTFWLIGRGEESGRLDLPAFALADESAKLNLNSATVEMLQWLPRLTPELATAILDWRDSDSTPGTLGAEDETYQRLNPPYRCKNADFESPDELRLVYGMDLEILLGEDTNLNGALDPNENDGEESAPFDNRDGRLDPGLLEYVTVFTQEPVNRTNGEPRVSVVDPQALAPLLQEKFGDSRANEVLLQLSRFAGGGGTNSGGGTGGGGAPGGGGGGGSSTNGVSTNTLSFGSVLEFYAASGLTEAEFEEVEGDLTAGSSTNTTVTAKVNVNTASETVLACIPGIGTELAPTLVAFRQSNPSSLRSMAWVTQVLGETNIAEAGPYLTGRSYQYSADIAAVGHHGRGYRRVRLVFDLTEGTPKVIYRQDLTHLGWALGAEARDWLRRTRENE